MEGIELGEVEQRNCLERKTNMGENLDVLSKCYILFLAFTLCTQKSVSVFKDMGC